MRANFEQGGVRYSLVVALSSRRELEARAADIRPDPTLWNGKSRSKAGIGIRGDGGKTWRNMHSTGVRPNEEEPEVRVQNKLWSKMNRAYVAVQPVAAVEFTDRPEYR